VRSRSSVAGGSGVFFFQSADTFFFDFCCLITEDCCCCDDFEGLNQCARVARNAFVGGRKTARGGK
jgi:hypothetical protein